jgi:iron complex transport system ATP-binding protein
MATYAYPTRGHVDMFGHRLGRVEVFSLRPRIGHVSPHHRVDPHRTVREVVLTGVTGTIRLVQRRETSGAELARAALVTELLGLGGRDDAPWRVLSQGERGRALVARAPMAQPRVLVTHHLEELPASTTHALLLRNGRTMAAGTVDAVLTTVLATACFGHPVTVTTHAGRWAVASLA